jgi:hypothetical protein
MLYVSPVQGRLVPRYGTTGGGRPQAFLGATRDGRTGSITWTPEAVLLLTDEEERLFGAEYRGHIRDGALVERTAKDYETWRAKQKAAKEAAKKKAEEEAAKKKAEEEAAKKAAPPPAVVEAGAPAAPSASKPGPA